MTASATAAPINFAVFVTPPNTDPTAGLAALLDLADRGDIDLLDLEIVSLDATGTAGHVDLDAAGLAGLEPFFGADSGLLDDEDIAQVAADLDEGETAVVVVYQDRSLIAVAEAFAAGGARLDSVGGIDISELDAKLGNQEGA